MTWPLLSSKSSELGSYSFMGSRISSRSFRKVLHSFSIASPCHHDTRGSARTVGGKERTQRTTVGVRRKGAASDKRALSFGARPRSERTEKARSAPGPQRSPKTGQ